jgi:hypothetical protein
MKRIAVAAMLAAASSSAVATPLALYPVQSGAETVRYHNGVPTLDLETETGAIEITPLPFDHGYVSLGVGVYNKGSTPANFGIENLTVTIGTQTVSVFSEDQLARKARSRAAWSAVGIALLAGAAAAAASTAHTTETSHGVLHTPHGSYSWANSYRDNTIGVVGATAATAGGVAGIVGVQNRLDYTLANLSESIVQTTTIDPDASYGGRVVIDKGHELKPPYDVKIIATWNGKPYPFVFRVTPQGKNLPLAYTTPPTSLPAGNLTPIANSPPAAPPQPVAPSVPKPMAASATKTS